MCFNNYSFSFLNLLRFFEWCEIKEIKLKNNTVKDGSSKENVEDFLEENVAEMSENLTLAKFWLNFWESL